jgi:hypothetical protein
VTKLKEIFTPNRVFALLGLIASVTTALVTFETSLAPGSPGAEAVAKAIVILGSLATFLGIVYKFMDGSQKMDQILHEESMKSVNQPAFMAPPAPLTDAERAKGFGLNDPPTP